LAKWRNGENAKSETRNQNLHSRAKSERHRPHAGRYVCHGWPFDFAQGRERVERLVQPCLLLLEVVRAVRLSLPTR